jgi:hypothetical protein
MKYQLFPIVKWTSRIIVGAGLLCVLAFVAAEVSYQHFCSDVRAGKVQPSLNLPEVFRQDQLARSGGGGDTMET